MQTAFLGTAFRQAVSGRPGPVFLDIPDDVGCGEIAGFAMTTMDAYGPGSCTWVGGFGHLGVGIPYGIAAKLAQPERPVVVITGDGSFGLGAMEFDTAVRHGVPIVCVIGNDTAWGQVKHGQEATFGPDRTPGTGLGWRSYEKVVAALGGHGERVDRLDEVGPALERAFASGLPACINVPTDPSVVFRGMTAMWPKGASGRARGADV